MRNGIIGHTTINYAFTAFSLSVFLRANFIQTSNIKRKKKKDYDNKNVLFLFLFIYTLIFIIYLIFASLTRTLSVVI